MNEICDVFYAAAEKANVPENYYYIGIKTFSHPECGIVRLGINGQYIYNGNRYYRINGKDGLRTAIKLKYPYTESSVVSLFLNTLPSSKSFSQSTSLARFCGQSFDPKHSYFISLGVMLQSEIENYMKQKPHIKFLDQYMKKSNDTEGDFVFTIDGQNIVYSWEQLTNTETDTTKTPGILRRLDEREKLIKVAFPEMAVQSIVFNPLLVDTTLTDARYGHVCGINHLMNIIEEPKVSDATYYSMIDELKDIISKKLNTIVFKQNFIIPQKMISPNLFSNL